MSMVNPLEEAKTILRQTIDVNSRNMMRLEPAKTTSPASAEMRHALVDLVGTQQETLKTILSLLGMVR